MRMLMNNLDPEVAERPRTWSSTAAPARRRATGSATQAIVATLRRLRDDETLLVQSGKPVGVFETHPSGAPRADRQRQPGARLGHLARVPATRCSRA